MGHSIGISGSYYRATENELLEDYLKAIDALTIDNDNMLERQFNKLEEKRSQEMAEFNLKIFETSCILKCVSLIIIQKVTRVAIKRYKK